ncbi:diaminopimelate decarboxylase [Dictyobacter kobayashii]|uniref:Diaminopimelate decarboxylase n=1 Tax=Dictyobacter kobayashii TaxID=2014872 RepID=A0A402AE05_9CHLR|nr:diaminopimelate decarboxylase [Dictyobacter kobayashii]GCE17338.1 diaminopimelate decarboxylase [Dictyobacter kobayashii]
MSSHLLATELLPDTATISAQGELLIAGRNLSELARSYGTPLYIFDRATIINACTHYKQAFSTYYNASTVRILYASKAYISPMLARLLAEQDLGLDVVSGGEMLVAQRVAFPMERVSFHGNNKSEAELRLALELGVGRIVLDNWSELERLTRLARETGMRPAVLVRVAPDIDTDTHKYLQTGHASAKFGFPLSSGEARAALLRILQDDQLELVGIHAHSGTLLRETRPYEECIERLLTLACEIHQETGWWPEEVSPGGGWGIETVEARAMPEIAMLARALQRTVELLQPRLPAEMPTLVLEPGRSIIARAGLAIYRIGATKSTPGGVNYLFVDGGMADNIRPALYGSLYTALAPEHLLKPAEQTYCLSGRYCESGDMLIDQVVLPTLQEGDLICLPTAGAYCLPMASNYNLVPRPAVIMIDEERIDVMERRETYADVLGRYNN